MGLNICELNFLFILSRTGYKLLNSIIHKFLTAMYQSQRHNARFFPNTQTFPNMNTDFGFQSVPNIIYANRKLEHINCIQEPKDLLGGLYLGDIICILKPQIIPNNGITAILSCLAQSNFTLKPATAIHHKKIPAKDTLDYPLHIHFDQTYDFIESMRKQNRNILIHCHAGVSRSAAIVCAYLIRKNNWTCEQALYYLRLRRNRIKPNENFLRILNQFQAKCLSKRKNESFGLVNDHQSSMPLSLSRNYPDRHLKVIMKKVRNSIDVSQQICTQSRLNKSFYEQMQDSRKSNKSSAGARYTFGEEGYRRFSNFGLYSLEKRKISDSQLKKAGRDGENNTQSRNIPRNKENKKQIIKQVQKDKLTFGNQFKNKISSLLGSKTRILWELSEQMNQSEWVRPSVAVNCL